VIFLVSPGNLDQQTGCLNALQQGQHLHLERFTMEKCGEITGGIMEKYMEHIWNIYGTYGDFMSFSPTQIWKIKCGFSGKDGLKETGCN